jgi:hypothetical protein
METNVFKEECGFSFFFKFYTKQTKIQYIYNKNKKEETKENKNSLQMLKQFARRQGRAK